MMDIIDRLHLQAHALDDDMHYHADSEVLYEAIKEIERLRAVSGAAFAGSSYADIAKDARHDPPIERPSDG